MKRFLMAAIFMVSAGSLQAHEIQWKEASNGLVPENSIVAGREGDGQALFICRTKKYAGGVHIGKVRAEFGACNFPYGGKELKSSTYEVLIHK